MRRLLRFMHDKGTGRGMDEHTSGGHTRDTRKGTTVDEDSAGRSADWQETTRDWDDGSGIGLWMELVEGAANEWKLAASRFAGDRLADSDVEPIRVCCHNEATQGRCAILTARLHATVAVIPRDSSVICCARREESRSVRRQSKECSAWIAEVRADRGGGSRCQCVVAVCAVSSCVSTVDVPPSRS